MRDLPRIVEIEKLAYMTPWPPSAYRRELQENRMARYIVVRDSWVTPSLAALATEEPKRPFPLSLLAGRLPPPTPLEAQNIIAFSGMWSMIGEAHVTTIAVHPDYRGHGVGELMLSSLIAAAYPLRARVVTLEVRVTNSVAQNLYRKYGFYQTRVQPRYYSDNHEDAYVMTTPDITTQAYRERFADLRARIIARLESENAPEQAYDGREGASGR
jgi:ribosomal-protein-alanine N-acetyltransferase